MAEDKVTVTLSRPALKAVLDAVDRAYITASASRHPHLVAHRERAEEQYQAAQAVRREVFNAAAEALGIEERV